MTDISVEKEIENLKKSLLTINGCIARLGESSEVVEVVLPKQEFTYIKLVLETDKNSNANKFYTPVDVNSFMLAGVLVRYR